MHVPFHDPLVIALENEYLGLSTDLRIPGVMTRTSPDLLSWSEPFPLLEQTPASVKRHVDTDRFWAPELVQRGDEWRLYCCASRFGTTQSVIGLAKAKSPKGPYTYVGDVVVSQHSSTFTQANAIDPCVVADRQGNDWLVYGSFFGGIRILRLNEEGFPAEYHEGLCIAGGGHQAIEGGYVWYHAPSDRFILFTSWGDLNEDYHIRVGYSREVTGPYLDAKGLPMTDRDPIHHPGDKLSGGYHFQLEGMPGVKATGHNSLLHDRDGSVYLVNHARPEGKGGRPFLQIRRLLVNEEGRVLAWPLYYDGAPLAPAETLPERWQVVYLSRPNNGVTYSIGTTAQQAQMHREGEQLTLTLFGTEWSGFIYRQGGRIACTLLSPEGESLWGIAE
ncbi:MAG: arabinan endo-1,5-alpha-L-arabinosidase [Clostridiales bacterium]|nr:arabinan endo-1,5-alpha-L-arabinosidase [Clostridiales bacterium]